VSRAATRPEGASPPTIRTVARQAGVGVGTVSRVLNGGSVSAVSRERVLRAIDALGFTPHTAARGLATNRTSTVGLVVNSTRGSWFSELIAGVEEALLPSRRSVLLGSLSLTGTYDPSSVEAWIRERRVDGILFVRAARRQSRLVAKARDAGLPIALIAPDEHTPAAVTVECDNVAGAALVAEHLADLGHRRIAFVGGPNASRDTRNRLRGVIEGLGRRGVSLPEAQVEFAEHYYWEGALPFADRFLRLPVSKRPTAVALASDALALGFMHALLDAGVRVPADVSVVGFDGAPEGELCWPGLTTVEQPSRRMARDACSALLQRIDGDDDVSTISYEARLIVRGSSGPPPAR